MNQEEIQKIRTANKLDDKLLKGKGVIGVDVDFKQVKGRKTEKLCIAVYVKKKFAREELSIEEAVPAELEGIPTDVVECLNVWPSPETPQQRPAGEPQTSVLEGGLAISNQNELGGYGTLGVVILSQGAPTALSCAHVMLSPPAGVGQGVIQPSGPQGGMYPADSIGTVSGYGYGTHNVDAALVPIIQGRASNVGVVQNIGQIQNYGTATIDETVAKMGARTGLRQGVVTSTTLTWTYTTSLGIVTFHNQIRVSNVSEADFALPGDSGSAVVNNGHLMVGMVVSGAPGHFTVCNTSTDLHAAIPTDMHF